jgi:DNA mismatch endonuclease, patch repair protein
MQANRAKDTSIELLLRKELFRRCRRYRIHVNRLPGRPDIVFPRLKVAIFVDGDFWHGFRLSDWQHKLSDYWVKNSTEIGSATQGIITSCTIWVGR